MTTAEQRESWKQVRMAIAEYLIEFGPIEVGTSNNKMVLDYSSRFPECGKIYCPNYIRGEEE